MKKTTITHQDLLKKWVKRLHLEDWEIILQDNITPEDFTIEGNCGECDWQEVNKIAVIRILNPIYYGVVKKCIHRIMVVLTPNVAIMLN